LPADVKITNLRAHTHTHTRVVCPVFLADYRDVILVRQLTLHRP